jgi:hypothetical protein
MGTGSKARPGRDADHSHPSSAEVKNEYELYLLSPHVPPWRVAGQLFNFLIYIKFVSMGCFKEDNTVNPIGSSVLEIQWNIIAQAC